MKQLRLGLTLVSAMAVSVLVAPGAALAQDAEANDATDTIDHIIAMGRTTGSVEKSMAVSFADLDLEKEPGALVLYQRLKRAAETVCDVSDAKKTRFLQDLRIADECFHRTLNAAVASVGSELVMSIHHERGFGDMLAATVQ